MALRVISRSTGKKLMDGRSSDHTGGSKPAVGYDTAQVGIDASAAGTSFEVQSDAAPYADNDDVWRRRFVKRGMSKLRRNLRRILLWLSALLGALRDPTLSRDEKRMTLMHLRPLKMDELSEHRRLKADRELFEFHRQQAKLIKARVIDVLTNLGFCFKVTKNERVYIKRKIKISQVDVSPYAYVFHINRVPFGVKLTEMAQDWVGTELAASIGKKTRYDLDLFGLRYTVEVGSTLSIPHFVEYGDEKYPMPKNQGPLAFWSGLTTNGSPVYRNLAGAPHLIIAGETGGGKSNIQNTIACTLIDRNPPERLRLVFFDLKGGVEFSHFEGIPHLWVEEQTKTWEDEDEEEKTKTIKCDGIVERPGDVMDALQLLLHECNRRLRILKGAKKKNIQEYNRGKHANNTIPYIVVFFDEWAVTKTMVPGAENILATIANISRAAGIHFILSTQYPKQEILNTTISVNFPWRLAFNMQSGSSQSVLGNWDAFGLSPSGRAVLKTNEGSVQVQTPRITERMIFATVEKAKSGHTTDAKSAGVDEKDILTWSIDNVGGKLSRETLFNQFKEKITNSELRDLLKSMEGQVYEVHGTQYKIIPGAGNLSRRMELYDEMEQGRSDEAASDILHPTEELEAET
jgi:S-DNA-T family DNA segregation ATPase FtsK/SpoIIIE